ICVVYQEGNTSPTANTPPEGALWALSSPQRRRRLRPPSSYSYGVTALTGLTVGGGCAAKYSASRLEELLKGFVPVEAENLLVGTAHPNGSWPRSGGRAGDALFLARPLGTGLVLAAKGDIAAAVEQMTTLNAAAADVIRPFEPNAVTDVTGFGLFGHAHEMAE